MSECHLFGNGPSYKAAPQTSIEHSYGCNIRIAGRPVRAIGCVDSGYAIKRLILQIRENPDGTGIYVPQAVYRHLIQEVKDLPWIHKNLEYGWSTETRMNYSFNCGQVMVQHLCKMYDVINLWGFDSLSTSSVYSWHHDLPDADLCKIRPTEVDQMDQHATWTRSWQKIVQDLGQKTTIVNNVPTSNGNINQFVLNEIFEDCGI